jgi:glucokinase
MFLGFDVGGSSIKVALIVEQEDGSIRPQALLTRKGPIGSTAPQEVAKLIFEMGQEVLVGGWSSVVATGIGMPGQIDANLVIAASNFPEWSQVPLADMVRELTGCARVLLLNDADAALQAEMLFGYGIGAECVRPYCILSLGTGVGGGFVLPQGKRFVGQVEIGHMIVWPGPDGRQCGCGQRGCLEAYSSASGIVRAAREAGLAEQTALDAEAIFKLASEDNEIARGVVARASETLGLACINICRILDCQAIILLGGLAQAQGLVEGVREAYEKHTWTILPNECQIQVSELSAAYGTAVGSIGAALATRALYPI